MICRLCGQDFPGQQAVQDVRYTTGDEGGKPIPMTLCPACAARPRGTLRFLAWVVVAFFVILGLVGLVLRISN
jgi:hypothetical protein